MSPSKEKYQAPNDRVTVRDIAKATGTHFTTVAKALRGSTGVKESTREAIQRTADEMGYQPDPLVSALSKYRSRSQSYKGTLYWINEFEEKNLFYDDKHYYGDCYRGAKQRCEEFGFRLETYWIPKKHRGAEHVSDIFKNRNATGIILGPTPYGIEEVELNWEAFTTVRIGYSESKCDFSTVTTNHFGNIRLLYEKLVSIGFQKIGFCCTKSFDYRSRNHWSGSYLAMQQAFHPDISIKPFLDKNPKGDRSEFLKWFNAERPQAIIAGDGCMYLDMLRNAGVNIPKKVQFVSLHADYSKSNLAGVMQNGIKVGRVAVEHLTAIIQRFERGLETDPRSILIDGEWVPGETFDESRCPTLYR